MDQIWKLERKIWRFLYLAEAPISGRSIRQVLVVLFTVILLFLSPINPETIISEELAARVVAVLANDTAEELAARVLHEESTQLDNFQSWSGENEKNPSAIILLLNFHKGNRGIWLLEMARVVLVFLLVVAFSGSEVLAQTDHLVGGDDGWSSILKVRSWLAGRVFRVGDKIWFRYPAAEETIVELQSLDEFMSCDISNPIKMYTDGLNHVTLEKEGTRYFTSGNFENCKNGMKLPVPVQTHPYWPAPPTPPEPFPRPSLTTICANATGAFPPCPSLTTICANSTGAFPPCPALTTMCTNSTGVFAPR